MNGTGGVDPRPPSGSIWLERLFLAALVWSTSALYVFDLGFYSDDWGHQVQLPLSKDQSFAGLVAEHAKGANLAVRPLQSLWYIVFYKLAPGNFLLPHLANHVSFTLAVLALHATLRRMAAFAAGAFLIAAIFVCLPHFVTAKLWYANHQSPLSLMLGFWACYQIVRLRTAGTPAAMALRTAAVVVLTALTLLAYELIGFVVLAWAVVAWFLDPARPGRPWPDRAAWLGSAAAGAGFLLAFVVKLPSYGATGNAAIGYGTLIGMAKVYLRAAELDFWTLGLFLPRAVVGILASPLFRWHAVAAAAATVAVLAAANRTIGSARTSHGATAWQSHPLVLLIVGGMLFAAGYLAFATNFAIGWSAFGMSNRVHAGAALGIAVIVYALYRLLHGRAPLAARVLLFALCACGMFVQVAVARVWADAWPIQNRIYAQLRDAVGPLRAGQSVALYGLCPFYGPASVFSASWDLGPRLSIDAGAPINADILTRHNRLTREGIADLQIGDEHLLPYDDMVIFNARDGSASHIRSFEDAQAFFRRNPLSRATPCRYQDDGGQSLY